jgi:DNA-binding CsgD family transcriptional regulator
MGRRGRRPHPDILTPREWEVLDLLRERLTNEQIAERLGITLDGAKYHVSEILSKLAVRTREEAAGWQPTPTRPWWQRLIALPVAATIGVLTLIAAAGSIGLVAWGALQMGNREEESIEDSPTELLDVGSVEDYDIGEPVLFEDPGFWLVRLEGEEFVALIDDDTHPRFSANECSIVWREDVVFQTRAGWFRGSCSGSNFDRDGSLVSGPSPLSMYRFHVEVMDSRVLVDVDFPLCPNEQPPNAACPRPPPVPDT